MNRHRIVIAGMLLGIGMGGFLDGIVFHQILQIHSMLSAELPQDNLVNVKVSMVWDGLFHALTWITTLAGIVMLWSAASMEEKLTPAAAVWGSALMGWGIFNVIEGVIDHHLLSIHHVVERLGESIYDYLFLASGVALIIIGFYLNSRADGIEKAR